MRAPARRPSAVRRPRWHPRDPALTWYLAELGTLPRLDARAERRLARRLVAARQRLTRLALEAEALVEAVLDAVVEPVVHGGPPAPRALATEMLAPLAAAGVIWRAHALAGCRRRPTPAPHADPRARTRLGALLAELPLRPDWLRAAAERAGAAGRLPAARARALRRAHHAWRRRRDRLAQAHLGLVVAIARTYAGPGLDLGELISAGNLGLLRAIERFDAARRTRLTTFAAFWIRHAVRQALAQDPERRARLRGRTAPVLLRLDAAVTDDGATAWIDTLPAADPSPLEHTLRALETERVRAAVARLAPPLRAALALRYGIRLGGDPPPEEAARALGLSPQGLRRRARQALTLLRHRLRAHGARP